MRYLGPLLHHHEAIIKIIIPQIVEEAEVDLTADEAGHVAEEANLEDMKVDHMIKRMETGDLEINGMMMRMEEGPKGRKILKEHLDTIMIPRSQV